MFDFGGLSDFGFGTSSVPFSGSFGVLPGTGAGAVSSSGSQTTVNSNDTSLWQSLATMGLDGFKSWLNYDLAQQQVAHGQTPSQNATASNLAAGVASSLSSYIPLLVIVLVIVGGYKLLFGKH